MRRFFLLIIGVSLIVPLSSLEAHAQGSAATTRACVTSDKVAQEIARLDAELNGISARIKNECAGGTVGRAEQTYFEFLSISVDSSEVMDSLKSLVDTSQSHALAHDIREYEAALDRIDETGKRAVQLCSNLVGTELTELKRQYIDGDADVYQDDDDAIAGLKRLKRVLDPGSDQNKNKFYQEEPSLKGIPVSYYDKESIHACTLPRYGLAEFKTILTRLRETIKNFKTQAQQIRPREGKTLYQEFLTDQQLLSVKDFRESLQRDERSNQTVGSEAASTQAGRVPDRLRNKDDTATTLGGTIESFSRNTGGSGPSRLGLDAAVEKTDKRNVSYDIMTRFVDEEAEMTQLINREVGTHLTALSALLDETDQIVKVDLCREALKSADFMVKACERISYCPGQVCDEAEPMRSCSP